jgi:sucrose-phosphate synthase
MTQQENELYIVLISVHGLIRGQALELGRDSDTGGQVKYVVELARALARQPGVQRVDLLTRQVIDKRVDQIYSQELEALSSNAYIIRLPCGPRRYLHKEKLWPYLDNFVDHSLQHFRWVGRMPSLIHGHYADAGYAGAQLARLLGVPFIFTGHSLGRVKKERLLEKGQDVQRLDAKFQLRNRFEAEETALDTASLVITSTNQEIKEQYELYDNYHPERMRVIPPGVDLTLFHPPEDDAPPDYFEKVRPFLAHPERPMILAMARPDERKNFKTLLQAYGESSVLQEKANLILIAGTRSDLREISPSPRRVLYDILTMIDVYDLYGRVAYPKYHTAEDVPDIYRMAAASRGVFVNPALTEPFGLTLLEAAASGVPVLATNDGGPRDILDTCHNGWLIDPLDAASMADAMLRMLEDPGQWDDFSRNGIQHAEESYSWERHAHTYLHLVRQILQREHPEIESPFTTSRSRLPYVDRILITDVDNTLTGHDDALADFLGRLENAPPTLGFGIATGRNLEMTMDIINQYGIPIPDILITSVGTEIYYGRQLVQDRTWQHQIHYHWQPAAVKGALQEIPGLFYQEAHPREPFKISYTIDPEKAPRIVDIRKVLRQKGIRCKVIYSHGMFLDVIPIRASGGLAIRYLTLKWGLSPERWLVAGDAGNDKEMLSGNTLGVVVGNYSPELDELRGQPRVYFARQTHARGILEGIDHYNFFGDINPDGEETDID